VRTIGNGLAVYNDRDGNAVAVDVSSGAEAWRTPGWIAAADSEAVYLCRGMDSNGLSAVDAASGDDLWETGLGCQSLVIHDELLTVVGIDPNVDGGNRLLVVKAATGGVVADEPFFDGIDDQVEAFDGAIAVGPNTVTSGPQANLVVLTADGTEVDRQVDVLAAPLGSADGVAVLGSYDRLVGYDVGQQTVLWSLDIDAYALASVRDGSVWTLDCEGGEVSRLDAQTGQALWSTSIGATTSFAAAEAGGTAYILTTQALIAIDNETGAWLWAEHRPYMDREPP